MTTKTVSYVLVTMFVLVNSTAAHSCGQKNRKVEEVDIIASAPSPSQEYVATSYIVSGGGAGGYVYKVVNLRATSEGFDPKKGIIFSVTGTHNLNLSWEDNEHLLIRHSTAGDIYVQAREWGSVKKIRISYVFSE